MDLDTPMNILMDEFRGNQPRLVLPYEDLLKELNLTPE